MRRPPSEDEIQAANAAAGCYIVIIAPLVLWVLFELALFLRRAG